MEQRTRRFFPQKLSSLKIDKLQLDDQEQWLAPMAAATAVEPLGALLHAPKGKCVRSTKPENVSAPLQFVPHQVRGFLNALEKGVVAGPAFDKSIACSPKVLSAYVADGFDLLARACNCTTYLMSSRIK
ncbi:hypothetical protein PsorP6_003503 [Peronosclerospora sorghi]|uniref:Uncharacterized protein n=1 Tax=Peronosclerospora sorghi TaxID=230839 RepID=A0ACC0VNL6_9STRA|nr:hypothetical protein PsorP6_003503 [Peronosclerospora sorghi]